MFSDRGAIGLEMLPTQPLKRSLLVFEKVTLIIVYTTRSQIRQKGLSERKWYLVRFMCILCPLAYSTSLLIGLLI